MIRNCFFLFFVVVPLSLSCQKGPARICNEEAVKWAEQHVHYYEMQPREVLATLPWTRQRSVYSRLSPEKKVQIWNEKIEVLKEEAVYLPAVIDEFAGLIQLLSPQIYQDDEGEMERQEYILAGKKWEERMRDVYHLSHEEIYFLAYKWVTEQEYYNALELDRPIMTKGGPTQPGNELPLCECSDWHDCLRPGCDTHSGGMCRKPDKACGISGIYECEYMCL